MNVDLLLLLFLASGEEKLETQENLNSIFFFMNISQFSGDFPFRFFFSEDVFHFACMIVYLVTEKKKETNKNNREVRWFSSFAAEFRFQPI